MTFIFWLQFATVCVAGAMSPGPSLALIIRNSITINRFAGFMTAVGHGLGMGVYAVFAVTGLSIILTANELLFQFCLLYTSPSPRDVEESRMPSSA